MPTSKTHGHIHQKFQRWESFVLIVNPLCQAPFAYHFRLKDNCVHTICVCAIKRCVGVIIGLQMYYNPFQEKRLDSEGVKMPSLRKMPQFKRKDGSNSRRELKKKTFLVRWFFRERWTLNFQVPFFPSWQIKNILDLRSSSFFQHLFRPWVVFQHIFVIEQDSWWSVFAPEVKKSAENDKNKKSAKTQKHELISFFPDAHSWYSTFSKATAKNRNQWRQATLDRKTHLLLAALQESFPIKPHFTPCAREVALSSLRTSFHKMASPSYFCNGSRGQ